MYSNGEKKRRTYPCVALRWNGGFHTPGYICEYKHPRQVHICPLCHNQQLRHANLTLHVSWPPAYPGIFKEPDREQGQIHSDRDLHSRWRLCYNACLDLGLIQITYANHTSELLTDELEPTNFNCIANLKDCQVKLYINPDVTPIAPSHRRMLFHTHQKVVYLEANDIIKSVHGPTLNQSNFDTSQAWKHRRSMHLCEHMCR